MHVVKPVLLSIEGASPTVSRTLFEVRLPVAPPRAHP
jgi:methylated-DNA-[protein]-cysteine S-methyltransferase